MTLIILISKLVSFIKFNFFKITKKNLATTSTVVTTTLEKPFNFAHFNNLYQNGESIHSKNQFITQTHHQKFENYLQFGKQSSNFFSNNNYNSFFHKNGYKRKCTSGDKQYLYFFNNFKLIFLTKFKSCFFNILYFLF